MNFDIGNSWNFIKKSVYSTCNHRKLGRIGKIGQETLPATHITRTESYDCKIKAEKLIKQGIWLVGQFNA